MLADSDASDEEMVKVELDEKPREKWDCESILSTYSTLYNHPQTIHEPKKVSLLLPVWKKTKRVSFFFLEVILLGGRFFK